MNGKLEENFDLRESGLYRLGPTSDPHTPRMHNRSPMICMAPKDMLPTKTRTRYADHICSFSCVGDKYLVWQDVRNNQPSFFLSPTLGNDIFARLRGFSDVVSAFHIPWGNQAEMRLSK
jgi:hypothetical protein